ncbi:serine--tRNA ligase [candidate division WWE3 bacterium RIFOXYC1_FULL_40_10]|uniref:Serine--tRNA ligase n=1 Tax=candidate division WWE3 bacterium RIFOXYA2_FULL_46_9 TaxID=1802636 RepID=A0A1F4VYK9_UNCKA|nr:MAG: serine--tRNA ligase [candidate division WWE3 bacterium RIFOXYB1_FULL_40_22]OGC61884.1 MAG: serine--tRNA ligase [candidate division WWE3 bacterium RIFOXYA1_FULL_40_11]OGC62251.1 MAG: serine--tRNA ligase [candidate division WWE3 bacterium RIFOXYA2_FULL_46_9]OGC64356.1 MAG: serine--tRNA ligase [candidate division WWE3 bacterium RIFOXYB2_FULL_41_6]OGC66267.1 MAG: serine--tRNA ligase [candidate division WWE3 bacterium RIFOXYC1_FULL_40_10]OGC67871.1 MAG: serine--tRNA ligase [candidate divisi
MLDIKFIKENIEKVKYAVKAKKKEELIDIDKLIDVHNNYLAILYSVEGARAEKNRLSEDIGKVPQEDRQKYVERALEIKNKLKQFESDLEGTKKVFDSMMLLVPNVIADDVPAGKDESENQVLRTWGEPKKFDFEVKDHVDIAVPLGIVDVETASKVTGSRHYYLKGAAVLLQFALVQYVLKTLGDGKIISELAAKVGNKYNKPFIPVVPPVLLKAEVAKKMDRFDPIDDRYYLEQDDQMLIGSAEHTLGPMFMDETLAAADLPLRFIGYSTAFRREAGTYGKDMRGMFRTHQFDKLEMEVFSTEEDGVKEQELIVTIQEYLVQQLEIPYQVMILCTGDMGKPDYKQIDINCWLPGQNTYRETHTSDYMTDYQARRLNTRYKDLKGNLKFVHMNDATAFAIGRILIAIIENYQQKDGSIVVPEVLRQYTGFDIIK